MAVELQTKPGTFKSLNIVFAIVAVTAILTRIAGPDWSWLHYIAKPLAIVLLLVIVLTASAGVPARYRWSILAGLAFSLCGDVFLMLPQDYFIQGLVCFLVAHCCYIAAFTSDVRFGARQLTFLICLILAVAMVSGLWSVLPSNIKAPVVVYAIVLALMAAQAIARTQILANSASRSAATGAILFMISDSILAYGKFRFDIPLEGLWVLSTYFAAQWFIARSSVWR
ncbi:lysoplasmalogenase [Phyllobacterium sp. YR531]|uniref:lysoplasmalogenase n=1 Tax=Phyllobacterium sp. YR531 TaxID=1144343 RepID=UPI00026FCC6E|nr:lysoplasmalogenase [Phyllobacterium sp. YR531]EJN02425.1 putative membrane protein [Phyllobacterium sp. YR531]